ncbi:uncharacterized protein LOC117225995 [Megalopta genalis]|uniref:uncharacterized protein LOC117225995 n=1 Tax=Megalopta genalis TaxID=115081 RepID=UPI003FD01B77
MTIMNIKLLNRISWCIHFNISRCQNVKYSTKKEEKIEIPQNELKKYYSANDQTVNGAVYDVKPFKFTCEAGKIYSWCLCGYSHSQPFCDGTHKNIFLKIKHRPIRFMVKETKDYWLCNCKQTSNRPFCDGTHRNEEIQSKIK